MMFGFSRVSAVALAALTVSVGCLSDTHRISGRELTRIAQLPPEQRGQRVRVLQEWSNADEPPAATPVHEDTTVVFVPVHIYASGPPAPGGRPGRGGGDGSGGGSKGGKADDAKAAAVVAVAIAATAVIIVGATEGARYDGDVQLHPMHPVHLYGRDGGYAVVPLSSIDPATAAWAERAVVVPSEGPWLELGRAPLNRRGWTYSVLMGAGSSVSADGSLGTGFASHIQIGYFPTQEVGVVGDIALGWRDNAALETLYDNRWSLELDYFPVSAGRFHAGVFGSVGLAGRLEEGIVGGNDTSTAFSGGAQIQLELTTRLALTGRFGLIEAHGDDTREVMVGLSVY